MSFSFYLICQIWSNIEEITMKNVGWCQNRIIRSIFRIYYRSLERLTQTQVYLLKRKNSLSRMQPKPINRRVFLAIMGEGGRIGLQEVRRVLVEGRGKKGSQFWFRVIERKKFYIVEFIVGV